MGRSFYQQLHELNEQITNMSARHQSPGTFTLPLPAPQVAPLPHDPFLDQINDVQTHIAHLDERLRNTRGTGLEIRPAPQPEATPSMAPLYQAPLPGISSFAEPNGDSNRVLNEMQPKDAHIAQMLTNLHLHLDTSLRKIASDVHALEERLDRLEPARFTPPGSEMSESDRAAPARELANPPSRDIPHLFMSSQMGHDSAADLTLQVKADAARSAIVTLDFCTRQMAKREHELTVADSKELIQDVFKFNRQLMDFSDMAMPTALPLFGELEQHQTDGELGEDMLHPPLASELSKGSEYGRVPSSKYALEDEPSHDHKHEPYSRSSQVGTLNIAPEGVAFRDQELNRMDELLKNSQEHLRDAQEALAHQASQLHEFQESSKEKDCRIHEWRQAYYELKDSTDNQAAAIQEFCEQKDAIIYKQEQIISRGARLLEQRDSEIDGLGRRLRAVEDDKDHEMRHSAQTARLLDTMKARQAAMRSEIASACAIPIRSPRRPNGELRDPDKQLALAKSRIARCAEVVGVPTPSEYDLEETVLPNGIKAVRAVLKADRRHVHRLWNEPGYLGAQSEDGPPWSPQPIKGNRRLPNEVRRAFCWEQDGGVEQGPQSGKPSPIGGHERNDEGFACQKDSRSPQHGKTSARTTQSASAHSREIPHFDNQTGNVKCQTQDSGPVSLTPQEGTDRVVPAVDMQEPAGGGRRVQDMQLADSRAADARASEPYSPGLTLYPPLPATVTSTPAAREPSNAGEGTDRDMGRMHSIHETSVSAPHSAKSSKLDGRRERRMSKHQSMQHLHRRECQLYQPYVETEAETGGGLGGEV